MRSTNLKDCSAAIWRSLVVKSVAYYGEPCAETRVTLSPGDAALIIGLDREIDVGRIRAAVKARKQPISTPATPPAGVWRVGKKVAINVYERDRPVCQCHTEEDARRIVDAMNVIAAMNAGVSLFPPQASIAPSDDDLAQRPTDSQDQSDLGGRRG